MSRRDRGNVAQWTLEDTLPLDQQRAFFEKAQQVAHVGVWMADYDGSDRLAWSAETYRIFGVEPGTFGGTPDAFFAFVHPDDRAAVHAASEAARAGGQTYDVDHRIITPAGDVRWVHEKADVVRSPDGRALRMIGTVQDITERRELEEQLRQAQKMEAVGRLAGGIAHDLNNALTAIAGYTELALSELADAHPARVDVEEIRRAASRAESVTRQLLAFSRKQLLEPRIFELNDTVESLARLLSRLLGPDIDLQTDIDQRLPSIQGDPGQVEQAIINLAVNARDAMPAGGKLTLVTSVQDIDESYARTHVPMPPGRYVVLAVTDTGQGMSPDTRSRIFEPFFTTKEIGKGTGLGLAMVYGTVKQSGGYIFVESEVGRGTTFRLYFPPVRAEDRAPAPPAVQAPSRPAGETLLVVEDEQVVRSLVLATLRREGYDVLEASSAEEAIEVAAAHPGAIDLLLTDARMPGLSGFELAQRFARERPGIVVVVMSGYMETSRVTAADAVLLLQKPFTPTGLRGKIREALGRRVR